ncbi:helix-hairpin-helix domain-containing protein [Streptomyces sp. NPDC012888]|uniref:helix-hairpin-helix domain-containing protein n=1 Tax=Streptomyces sp. NPDC012888 TaxID=3364855 RepID=UPI0036A2368E
MTTGTPSNPSPSIPSSASTSSSVSTSSSATPFSTSASRSAGATGATGATGAAGGGPGRGRVGGRGRGGGRGGGAAGPGRAPGSDSRFRRGRIRERRRRYVPDPAAVRLRAHALLADGTPPPAVRAVPEEPPPAPPPEPRSAQTPLERLTARVRDRCGWEPRPVAAVALVLVAAVAFAAQQYWSARPEPVTAPAAVVVPAPAAARPSPASGPRVVVDIGGKVRDPGVRQLPAGSRVADALAAAGGIRPGTDTTGLNRARLLVDGEHLLVGLPAQAVPPPAPAPGAGPAAPLSLASATVEQLDGLPGVGPVLAQHIVDYRTARGGFRSVDELRQVNGIGERRFADLRPLVRP